MKNIKVIDNEKYSRSSFDDYKFRGRVEIKTVDSNHNLDVYTTSSDRAKTEKLLLALANEKVTELKIVCWSTREQDNLANEMLNEWLKEV